MANDIGSMQTFERLLHQIGMQLNQNARCFLGKNGLSQSRYWVISNLSVDQPLTMGTLQKRIGLSSATLTGLVDGLVETNLVRRWRDDQDRRVVFLALTPTGASLRKEVWQYRTDVLRSAISGQQIDLDSLNTTLNDVLVQLKQHCTKQKEGVNNTHDCQDRTEL